MKSSGVGTQSARGRPYHPFGSLQFALEDCELAAVFVDLPEVVDVPNLGSARIVEDSLPKAEKFSAKQCMQSRVQTTGVPRCLPRGAVCTQNAMLARCGRNEQKKSNRSNQPELATGAQLQKKAASEATTSESHPAATAHRKEGRGSGKADEILSPRVRGRKLDGEIA